MNRKAAVIASIALVACLVAASLAVLENKRNLSEGRVPFLLNDKFDTGLDNWSYWGGRGGGSGYVLEWVSNVAEISGDGYLVEGGMQKVVDLSGWDESGALLLSFDWRAISDISSSEVTQAILWIQDADSSSSLLLERLVRGGTLDTGWRNYVNDISSYVIGYSRIRIILYVEDGWSTNWHQTNFYDNIRLSSTTSP